MVLRCFACSIVALSVVPGCIVPARVDLAADAASDRPVIVRRDASADALDAVSADAPPDVVVADASVSSDATDAADDAADAVVTDGATEAGDAPDATIGCEPGLVRCGLACIDPLRDPGHCGTCDTVCPAHVNMVARCIVGTCGEGCVPGHTDCNGDLTDGCETATDTDPQNCGACGAACSLANATAGCASAACTVISCGENHGDCNRRADDGCEATLDTTTNCGACNAACLPAHANGVCTAGACAIASCTGAYDDCNGIASDGCETSLRTIANCGACGRVCAPAGATGACDPDGRCVIASCANNRADCNARATDGCETAIDTATDCGMCGRDCTKPHSTSVCEFSACRITTCEHGYANCNGDAIDGCEAVLANDRLNCGACGVACASGLTCQSGVCARPAQPSCPTATEAGCGLVTVTGSTFVLGSDDGTPGASPAVVTAMIGNYAVDSAEVTVARFRRWWIMGHPYSGAVITYPSGRVDESLAVNEPTTYVSDPDCNWSFGGIGRDTQPLNCVDWSTALAFCAWEGGRLPTEAEWEFVARDRVGSGQSATRTFPWGEATPTGVAGGTCTLAQFAGCAGDAASRTRVDGSFAATGGFSDLGGNVAEWTADSFDAYNGPCWPPGLAQNPFCNQSNAVNPLRTVRGGSWSDTAVTALHGTARIGIDRTSRLSTVGFRCARTR